MPRIDFYVLPDIDPACRLKAACRLTAKAWQQALRVFIRCQDDHQQQALDELLWCYRPERFIPHNGYLDNPSAPVVLGQEQLPPANSVLINLAASIPPHWQHCSRLLEIVCHHPAHLQASRQLFRQYQQLGQQPQRIKL